MYRDPLAGPIDPNFNTQRPHTDGIKLLKNTVLNDETSEIERDLCGVGSIGGRCPSSYLIALVVIKQERAYLNSRIQRYILGTCRYFHTISFAFVVFYTQITLFRNRRLLTDAPVDYCSCTVLISTT